MDSKKLSGIKSHDCRSLEKHPAHTAHCPYPGTGPALQTERSSQVSSTPEIIESQTAPRVVLATDTHIVVFFFFTEKNHKTFCKMSKALPYRQNKHLASLS